MKNDPNQPGHTGAPKATLKLAISPLFPSRILISQGKLLSLIQNTRVSWRGTTFPLSIDLQKMNWKFRAGFHEHTGVSLKEHLPNNPIGGYTRVHQDTAQSRHRQRPPQPSAARLSAR